IVKRHGSMRRLLTFEGDAAHKTRLKNIRLLEEGFHVILRIGHLTQTGFGAIGNQRRGWTHANILRKNPRDHSAGHQDNPKKCQCFHDQSNPLSAYESTKAEQLIGGIYTEVWIVETAGPAVQLSDTGTPCCSISRNVYA